MYNGNVYISTVRIKNLMQSKISTVQQTRSYKQEQGSVKRFQSLRSIRK